MSVISIKRGATLSLTASFANADGTPYALAGVVLTAHVRDAAFNLVVVLTPVAGTTPGQATITVQDTSTWPEGLLRVDILAQPAGGPQSISPTFGIMVQRAVTELLPEGPDPNPVTDGLSNSDTSTDDGADPE